MNKEKVEKGQNLISEAKTVALVPSKIAGTDSFAAAVGLYYMLTESGKDVYFVYPGKIPDEATNLISKDRIVSNVSERELMVTIDYAGTPAASAHYATEGDKLIIKVGPVSKEFPKDEKIKSELVGFDFDVIIVLGAQELADLGGTFSNLRESFNGAKVINIDNTERNAEYGDVNLIDVTAGSLSQQVFKLASALNLVPGEKTANALLTGMTY